MPRIRYNRGMTTLIVVLLASFGRVAAAAPAAPRSACAYDGSFCVELPGGLAAVPIEAFNKDAVTPLLLVSSGTAHTPLLILTAATGSSAKTTAHAELARLRAIKDVRFSPTDAVKVRLPNRWWKSWAYRNGCLDATRCQDWEFVYLDDGRRVIKASFPTAEREAVLEMLGGRRSPVKKKD